MQNQQKLAVLEHQNTVVLWSKGQRQVPVVEMNDNMLKALAFARRCGSLRVGLEQIQTILQAEETGLVLIDKSIAEKKSKGEMNISRLILVSNDGADRFYRHTETILNMYSHRLFCVKLNVSSLVLGNIFYGKKDKPVKALFVNRKETVLRVLSSFI